ncbi:signal recognition particle-docking protein FtsY [Rhizobium sp. P32RR-XVIII]|uniref:signal recognition particle-docking protein FtsY n=1 Tax=Rhizobium sp. P32RR-XVIII TaxID=2726738 RepID=UPI001456DEEE|nr:signal recognition particle-docking protein FtsY [Rhizobium sp. P32RR-XVIII]NLS05702.1 signal recognition particle-docking protein FtsY [Rhizobium sp. P32RR-XVIII]
MALSFIKKVFTFGKEKPVEEQVPETVETKALDAELEPHSREENLPLANDPVLAEEMDTAGGPTGDLGDNASVEELAEKADALAPEEDDVSEVLPPEVQAGDMGLVPLSLLEAEAEAEVVAAEDSPPTLPGIPPTGGETEARDAPHQATEVEGEPTAADVERDDTTATQETADYGQDAATSLAPLVGGMPGRVGGEIPESDVSAETPLEPPSPPLAPILPRGFATGSAAPEPAPLVPQPKLSWFQRLRAGLARTSSQLTGQISALFTKRKLDDDTLQDLEDLLIQADLGVETAMRVTDTLASERYGKDVTGEDVSRIMASEIAKVLKPVAKPLQLDLSHKPHVILVVGVNGTGKTTTIGKLAAKLSGAGLKVMVAAGDTFRAAAIEQLKIWADRTKSEFIGTKLGADAAGLAYDAFEQAKAKKCDVLIIDTAGRLQNKAELMAELEKIVRVLGRLDPDAPHTVLQTLDATTGQNALNQVEIFRNVAGVNGLIMTKLDGTARGGILVAISAKHKLPVYFIGVGEGVDDLEPFEAEDFAHAIAGLGQ